VYRQTLKLLSALADTDFAVYCIIRSSNIEVNSTASFLGVEREGGGLGAHDLVGVHPY
jgi:hypothetical protein